MESTRATTLTRGTPISYKEGGEGRRREGREEISVPASNIHSYRRLWGCY